MDFVTYGNMFTYSLIIIGVITLVVTIFTHKNVNTQRGVRKIKVFVPEYFDEFKCIADKCPDTCCIGWEVDIDSDTAEKYKTVSGKLGEKIKKHLIRDEDGCEVFTLCEGDRCPFLNDCQLCEIQLNLGEEALSKTCTLFPRFFDDFGKIREMGLGFGCPEAAKIILTNDEPFSLRFYDECVDEVEDVDEDFLSELIDLRADCFIVLEDDYLKFEKKIEKILDLASDFQRKIDGEAFSDEVRNLKFSDCLDILEKMEYISEERKNFMNELRCKKLSARALQLYKSDFEKLMRYYLFRYLLKAVYDYDALTKVKYGVFACIVISRIYGIFKYPDLESRIKIMCGYSKEVEYSNLNMELLDDAMYEFSATDLTSIL